MCTRTPPDSSYPLYIRGNCNPSLSLVFTISLFNNPANSDFKIVASDETTFHAHTLILGMYTTFFSDMLTPSFCEASDSTLLFRYHDAETIKAFLEYCYKGAYGPVDKSANLDLKLYQLADYVYADGVKSVALNSFKNNLIAHGGKDYEAGGKDYEAFWANELPKCVDTAYRKCSAVKRDMEIQAAVVAVIKGGLIKMGRSWKPFEPAVREHPDFAAEMVGFLMWEIQKSPEFGLRRAEMDDEFFCPMCKTSHVRGKDVYTCRRCRFRFPEALAGIA